MDQKNPATGDEMPLHPPGTDNPGMVSLIAGIDPRVLTPEMGRHLADLQSRIDAENRLLSILEVRIAPGWFAQGQGKSRKFMLEGHSASGISARFIYKPYHDPIKPAQIEFVTILNNLMGVRTPIAVRHALQAPGDAQPRPGIAMRWLDGMHSLFEIKDYDFARSSPEVLEYLMLTRWVNQIVGNLDCFAKQYIVPADKGLRYRDIVMIDMDSPFERITASEFRDQMVNIFGYKPQDVPIELCGWLDRVFAFEDPVGWAPGHYDSPQNIYGWLLRDYILGRLNLDLPAVKERIRFAAGIPERVVCNAMRSLLDVAGLAGALRLPAAEPPFMSPGEFEMHFIKRLYRSAGQFCSFLDELAAARNRPGSAIYTYYEQMKPLPF